MLPLASLLRHGALSLLAVWSFTAAASTPLKAPGLQAFGSEQELAHWLEKLQARNKDLKGARRSASGAEATQFAPAPMAVALAADKAGADGITNNQTAGVDEGGIVKSAGRHLVVLRRGRLFSIEAGDRSLRPVSMIDVFPPEMKNNPRGAWYDEMLIHGRTIIVIGYSYGNGGTEVSLFDIDDEGRLRYGSTYHLRSADYYSSRNYASRLVGNKLIFYAPLPINVWGDPYLGFPGVRKWQGRETPQSFTRLAPATRIYRNEDMMELPHPVLHTITSCELESASMQCEASAVVGPYGREFYVSPTAVYVWTGQQESLVFRLPLDGAIPSAAKTRGMPIDQFSFFEGEDGYLNVLVREFGRGGGMWGAEKSAGRFGLLRTPLREFDDGKRMLPDYYYRELPGPQGWTVHNRFVGAYLLYGAGSSWHSGSRNDTERTLYTLRFGNSDAVEVLPLGHAVQRIEALGNDAVVVGPDGNDLVFSSIRLDERPRVANRYLRSNAAQGETRSHGFFYKPEGDREGLLGLPIRSGGAQGYRQLYDESASVLYLRNEHLKLDPIGSLHAQRGGSINDNCKASCVDWYGNSRPIFLRGRIYALMGYELVEGALNGSGIQEVRRISFAPGEWSRE
jgi:hypothetical protein